MTTPAHGPILLALDITGSVPLHQRVEEHEAQRAIERCLTRIHRAIEGHQGEILEELGDELLCRFGNGDDAIRGALEMQARVADLPPVSGHKLNIRIALFDGDEQAAQTPLPKSVRTAALSLIARAEGNQIVCSRGLADALAASKEIRCNLLSSAEKAEGLPGPEEVFQLLAAGERPTLRVAAPTAPSQRLSERLCVRHQGKAFLIDERTPILSIGRDAGCVLQIDDRKVSRHHARIERRADGYFLVDSSTNGSFLTLNGRPEILLRQDECVLQGSGQICFGGSANDWSAERIDFEGM